MDFQPVIGAQVVDSGGLTSLAIVPSRRDALEDLIGEHCDVYVTYRMTALITAREDSHLPFNPAATAEAARHGLDRPIFGDLVVVGYDGERFVDAPELVAIYEAAAQAQGKLVDLPADVLA